MLILSQIVYTNCTILSDLACFMQAFGYIITGILSGYGITALALYRLYLIRTIEQNKRLSLKVTTFSLALIWLLPITFSIVEIFAFKSNAYFFKEYSFCIFDVASNYYAYGFYVFGNFALPNLILILSYLYFALSDKNKIGSSNKIQTKKRQKRPK